MDPIKIEKLQAMKRYRRSRSCFLLTVIQYCLSVLMLGLFLSSPLWLPSVCSSIKHFFMVSIPKMGSIIMGPKCLFVLFNIIIIFLVGESKLSGSAPATDIYEEYVKQSQSLRRLSSCEGKEKEVTILERPLVEERKEKDEEVEKEEEAKGGGDDGDDGDCGGCGGGGSGDGGGEEEMRMGCEDLDREEEVSIACEDLDREEEMWMVCEELDREEEVGMGSEDLDGEEEEKGLPADELNRRVEDFIARVNMQRMLEARVQVCCG